MTRSAYIPSPARIIEREQDSAELSVMNWQYTDCAKAVLAKIVAVGGYVPTLADELEAVRNDVMNDAWASFGEGWSTYWATSVEPLAITVDDAIDMALDAAAVDSRAGFYGRAEECGA